MIDYKDALEQCETILELIEYDIPSKAREDSPDFFEPIEERVTSMAEWITSNERITPKMAKALDNMEAGVRKWIRE